MAIKRNISKVNHLRVENNGSANFEVARYFRSSTLPNPLLRAVIVVSPSDTAFRIMTGRVTGISASIPEPHRETIRKLTERIYKDAGNQNVGALNLTAGEVDQILRDISRAIENVNAALKGTAWTEAYTALTTLREVVQNFSASLSMRRASLGQYDTPWPGSRWKGSSS